MDVKATLDVEPPFEFRGGLCVVDAGDKEAFEGTKIALERIGALIGEVLTLVRQDFSASALEPISCEEEARESWGEFETVDCTLEVMINEHD